jgi:hypothetical protein
MRSNSKPNELDLIFDALANLHRRKIVYQLSLQRPHQRTRTAASTLAQAIRST